MSVAGQTPTVDRILAFIAAHPGTTSGPVADALGITPRDVGRRLADAMKRGYVTRTGGTGFQGFAYRVTATGKARVEGVAVPAAVARVDARALPERAAELVWAEPFSSTAEVAAELGVDLTRARQALNTAARRGHVVGQSSRHGGRVEVVWRAVGIGRAVSA